MTTEQTESVMLTQAPEQVWRPIESAPLDGTRVLLWTTTEGDRALTDYLVAGGSYDLPFERAQIGLFDDVWQLELVGNPTHWMPLPDRPL